MLVNFLHVDCWIMCVIFLFKYRLLLPNRKKIECSQYQDNMLVEALESFGFLSIWWSHMSIEQNLEQKSEKSTLGSLPKCTCTCKLSLFWSLYNWNQSSMKWCTVSPQFSTTCKNISAVQKLRKKAENMVYSLCKQCWHTKKFKKGNIDLWVPRNVESKHGTDYTTSSSLVLVLY